jgi:protein involved in polysaccharide export with SLBB domain
MFRHLLSITVFLGILSCTSLASGQTSRPRKATPSELAANGSTTSSGASKKIESQNISGEASSEAKRIYEMGVKYGRARLFRQAAESFQKALNLKPDYADAYYGLGQAYLDMGRWQEAIQSLEQAIRYNPGDERAQAKLSEARLMRQQEAKPPPDTATLSSQTVTDQVAGDPVSLNASSTSRENNAVRKPTPNEADLTRIYRVGVGDVLDVKLGDGVADRSTLFTITPSGCLEHPNIAEPLVVSGLTVEEITALLDEQLRRRAQNEKPKVLVGVSDYVSHAILVSGLVKEPGRKILRREAIPLFVVIADAQPLAEAGQAILLRHESNEVISVNLSTAEEMNLLVRPGDVITLHPSPAQFFYVGGEVKSPGEWPYRRGLTLTQAIIAAGGLVRESKEVQLARDNGYGFLAVTRYKLKDINSGKLPDPLIQPGDRITVVR